MVKMVITSGPVDFYGTAPGMTNKRSITPNIKQILDGTWEENPFPGFETGADIDVVYVNLDQFAACVGLSFTANLVATDLSQFVSQWNDQVHNDFEEIRYSAHGMSITVKSAEEIAALIALGYASNNPSSGAWGNTPQPNMQPQPSQSLFNLSIPFTGWQQPSNNGPGHPVGYGGDNMKFTPPHVGNQTNRPIFTPQMRNAARLVLEGLNVSINISSDHGNRYLSGVEFPSPTDMPVLASHPMFSVVVSEAIRVLLAATPQYHHHELYGDSL